MDIVALKEFCSLLLFLNIPRLTGRKIADWRRNLEIETNRDAVADPGFPQGGGANSPGGGANIRFCQKFPKICMKLKEFGPPGGARVQNFTM